MIANGVDPTLFDPAAKGQGIHQEFHVENKFVVTYAGAIGMANDIGTILNAADLLRQIGNSFSVGRRWKRADQHAKPSCPRGLNNITFTGALPKGRMPELLAASDVCVATLQNIPMFTTTYPNKIFDYMAAGRPTVLAIDGVIRQVVEDAGGGIFVQPGDPKALADAVGNLEPRLRDVAHEMGLRGSAACRAVFSSTSAS